MDEPINQAMDEPINQAINQLKLAANQLLNLRTVYIFILLFYYVELFWNFFLVYCCLSFFHQLLHDVYLIVINLFLLKKKLAKMIPVHCRDAARQSHPLWVHQSGPACRSGQSFAFRDCKTWCNGQNFPEKKNEKSAMAKSAWGKTRSDRNKRAKEKVKTEEDTGWKRYSICNYRLFLAPGQKNSQMPAGQKRYRFREWFKNLNSFFSCPDRENRFKLWKTDGTVAIKIQGRSSGTAIHFLRRKQKTYSGSAFSFSPDRNRVEWNIIVDNTVLSRYVESF